ncbi:MAG: cation:proton antiporter [Candidatus Bathyarchaeota archaeon]|nr:cation:proton antiporter [Candidatus Bathyarchaeum tardum]WGM89196.1 MAG: cation:proton antiporter [Candidatus Bathyarchaeum tardum]
MIPILLFLIWIAASFFFPVLLRRFQIPWVTAVIFAGMILGPYGLNAVESGEIMDFFATIGLIFLMFTAGLDTQFSVLKKSGRTVVYFAGLNLIIPFITGFFVGICLGLSSLASLILGTCFSSSSVGLIVPMLRELDIESNIKSTVVSAIFLEDVISLIILAVLLNAVVPVSPIPLAIFPVVLLIFVLIVLYLIPILQEWLFYFGPKKDAFAAGLRAVFITLALVAFMAELIGVHAMVGGFLAGLTLSDMLKKRKQLEENIIAVSYGFLIPVFLLSLGMTTNMTAIFAPGDLLSTGLIILSLIVSKSVSGFLGGRLVGFPSKTSLGMGIMTIAQMSTTLATASLAFQYGLLSESILAGLVLLSIVTIILTPFLTKLIFGHKTEKTSKFSRLWLGNGN